MSESDPASPQTVSLTGVGTVVGLSSKALWFGKQPVGTSSKPRSTILLNADSAPLTFSGITVVGADAGDFSQTNSCGAGIAGGAGCTIWVTFKPTTAGVRKAVVSISDDGGGSPQTISLEGVGW